MKLLIKDTCVVDGGKIASRGDVFDTKVEDKANDRTAFELIAAGRAVKADTAEANEILAEIKKEREDKAAQVAEANRAKK